MTRATVLKKTPPAETTAGGDGEAPEAASAVWRVVEGVLHGVHSGKYVPGQRLISQELSRDFNVSRAPVREALHVLAGEGVVDLVPNRGARVRRLAVTQLVDFLELTEAVLVLGIRRGASNIHLAGNRSRLDEAFRKMELHWRRRDPAEFVNSIYHYHLELNRISQSYFVDLIYRRPYNIFFNRLLAEYVPGGEWEQYIWNYRRIHETIIAGDAHAAVATFVAHIQWVLSIMRRNLETGRISLSDASSA